MYLTINLPNRILINSIVRDRIIGTEYPTATIYHILRSGSTYADFHETFVLHGFYLLLNGAHWD